MLGIIVYINQKLFKYVLLLITYIMINDLDINLCPLTPLEFQTNQQQLKSE